MQQLKKIDCHTHIVTEDMRDEYFSQTDGFAVVMQFLPAFVEHGYADDSYRTAMSDERLFFCPCIDLCGHIPKQLQKIESMLPNDRIVGLKMYLTYQTGRADDEKMLDIYEFAKKHRLSITFHTGSCALCLPSDNDIEGSNAIYVRRAADMFPEVNFILAHMDDPRYNECIRVMRGSKNMFTDFCGAYEPGTKEGADMDWAINTFAEAINQYPDTYKQILYGTDFCPAINLSAIKEYETTISRIFAEDTFEDIYVNNALRAFPKIKDYIERKVN